MVPLTAAVVNYATIEFAQCPKISHLKIVAPTFAFVLKIVSS